MSRLGVLAALLSAATGCGFLEAVPKVPRSTIAVGQRPPSPAAVCTRIEECDCVPEPYFVCVGALKLERKAVGGMIGLQERIVREALKDMDAPEIEEVIQGTVDMGTDAIKKQMMVEYRKLANGKCPQVCAVVQERRNTQ